MTGGIFMERIYIATIIISIQEHQILFDVTPFDEYNKALKYIKERLKHKYTKINRPSKCWLVYFWSWAVLSLNKKARDLSIFCA